MESTARHALTVRPGDPRVIDMLGRALLAMNRPEEAAREFERALQIDPGYAPSRQSLAIIRGR